ncbi:MAG: glutaredoxin [Candidatus Moraniibacteriota bacterium]|nr:MAG: glutaredoxin [Candidatus Moranbacteria bacterium]
MVFSYKKISFIFVLTFSFLFTNASPTLYAQNINATSSEHFIVYVFAREDCRHCLQEKEFLNTLKNRYDFLEIHYLDIYTEPYASQWKSIAQLEKLPLATPITLVGDTVLSGFETAETTGKKIEDLILTYSKEKQITPEKFIEQGGSGKNEISQGATCLENSETGVCAMPSQELIISLPFFGATDLSSYPVPFLSLILGFVDGFNPCAMWVLVTFLLFLSQSSSRKQIFSLVGIFLFSQAIIYFFILNLWLTTWNFVKLDTIITPLIGIVAIGGGVFFLYEWLIKKGVCSVTAASKREKIIKQIKSIISSPFNLSTILAVVFLSFSITIIEFACSIGIPQTFTKIIEMNGAGFAFQQSMVGLYIFTYMLDDLFVFAIALKGIEKIHLTSKYSTLSNLIGGVLMLILGFLLLFAPNLLQFG